MSDHNMSTKDHQIDYIEYGASDIPAIKQFYSDVFGWKFEDYGPHYTSFSDGRISGGFFKTEAIPAKGALTVIYAADLSATETQVKASGGIIVKPIFSFPGGRRFHFADPSGNELAVWSE